MSNRMELIIGRRVITDVESYRVSSDLFEAADAFSVRLADPNISVAPGQRCMLTINGITELNGIMDQVTRSYDETGRRLEVAGRDLMGLVVDSYCTVFPDLQGTSLKSLAHRLLADIPYVNRLRVIYGRGDKSRAVEVSRDEEEYKYTQIRPGQTVFDVLKEKALEAGMLFFSLPDGTIVFGTPEARGKAQFSFITETSGVGNNILGAELDEDISRRHSSVTVMGQRQGDDDIDAGSHNILATISDNTFPIRKPYVATIEHDGMDPKNYAKLIIDGERFDGWRLTLKVPGHSQNGMNYRVNAVCHVKDEVLGLNTNLLCYGRDFELNKQAGACTTLRLGRLGVVPS